MVDGRLFFVREYFSGFREKINRLEELFNGSFQDEALTLCVVYIDYLASGTNNEGFGRSKENFCRALCDLSGEDFFSMIHPDLLVAVARWLNKDVQSEIEQMLKTTSGCFLTQAQINQYIAQSPLPPKDKNSMTENLWRASVAAICYDKVRCQAVHGPGVSTGLSFDRTSFNGKVGTVINFACFTKRSGQSRMKSN